MEATVRQPNPLLVRESRRCPHHLVTYTYYSAHGGHDERRDITVRELAEEQLKDMESN